jgi:hypothetical protein
MPPNRLQIPLISTTYSEFISLHPLHGMEEQRFGLGTPSEWITPQPLAINNAYRSIDRFTSQYNVLFGSHAASSAKIHHKLKDQGATAKAEVPQSGP